MKSIREIYKIGRGPSSSHTMGPVFACEEALRQYPHADRFDVTLYGSLALTGKGHMTDRAIMETLGKDCTRVVTDTKTTDFPHPNTMDITAYQDHDKLGTLRAVSVGGGSVAYPDADIPCIEGDDIYSETSFAEIVSYCQSRNIRIPDYVLEHEGPEIITYLEDVWKTMNRAIFDGLVADGELPGGLHVQRCARRLYNSGHIDESEATRENRMVCAYAYAVSEQNADAGTIVTAPTCGSCGVVPAALKYMQEKKGFSDKDIIRALMTGGVIGNIIKTNASISGAEAGCQAEIGSACAMCAAALAELHHLGLDQIEYAAEVAMEHMLGLTCDPVKGLVQIPCIERNAVAAMRAINALSLSNFLVGTHKISFDMVVKTMYKTGLDINARYRETSEGGLAELYHPESE